MVIKTDYFNDKIFSAILMLLTKENRLAMKISLETGARIDDVLSLKTSSIQNKPIVYVEKKTGKKRTLKVSKNTHKEMIESAGVYYLFPNRRDSFKHRTRQAVWKDIKRAQKALRIKENLAPHSARKNYAVRLMKKYNSLEKVQKELNHSSPETTMIYALAQILTEKGIDINFKK